MRTRLRTMSPTPPQAVARPLPPLAVAAARGDVTALEALLAEGLDLNTTNFQLHIRHPVCKSRITTNVAPV